MGPDLLIVVGVLGSFGAYLWYTMTHNAANSATTPSSNPGSTVDNTTKTVTYSADKVTNLATAIAQAEGADQPGTAPQRYGNPGDLSVGDDFFGTSTGSVTLPDGERLLTFNLGPAWNAGDGWDALVEKVRRMLSGQSSTYPLSLTWREVAAKYAGACKNDPNCAWVQNVTNAIGVDPDSTIEDYANS